MAEVENEGGIALAIMENGVDGFADGLLILEEGF